VAEDARAVDWYRRAIAAQDGSVTFSAVERLAFHLARRGTSQGDRSAGTHDVDEAIGQLLRLTAIAATAERHALLGALFKQQAQRSGDVLQPLVEMENHFAAAERLAGKLRPDLGSDARLQQLYAQVARQLWTRTRGGRQMSEPPLSNIPSELDLASDDAPRQRPTFAFELAWLRATASRNLRQARKKIDQALDRLDRLTLDAALWRTIADDASFVLARYAEQAGDDRRAAHELIEALERRARASSAVSATAGR
jgi:hypothetical protein